MLKFSLLKESASVHIDPGNVSLDGFDSLPEPTSGRASIRILSKEVFYLQNNYGVSDLNEQVTEVRQGTAYLLEFKFRGKVSCDVAYEPVEKGALTISGNQIIA